MNPKVLMLAAAAVIGLGAVFYVMRDGSTEQPAVEAQAPVAEQAPAFDFNESEAQPSVRHPIPGPPEATAPGAPPLPSLVESDLPLRDSLSGLVGKDAVTSLLMPTEIIRRTVATIDSLPRNKVAVRMRPVMPAEGRFAAMGGDDELVLDESNYARYAPFIRAVQAADAQQLTALYFRFYPLFQQAYEDLGYPGAYFNDRVVEVIDHLLETPDVQGPVRLVRPHVLYEFADAQLEGRSAGQKLLIRMGNENAAALKAKLREIRTAIAISDPGAR